MIGQAVPLFQAGNLLTKEMLNAIKEYSFNFSELLFQGYSDGILCGCRITTTKSLLQLNPGIILYRGKVYLITQPMTESYFPTHRDTYFKIRIKDEIKTQNFIYLEMESSLDHEPARAEGELELCRFKLQEGFKLRADYQSFDDRITEYDTVNSVYSPFSSFGGKTLSPEVTLDFAKRMAAFRSDNPLDQMFCMQAFQAGGRAVDLRTLSAYLSARLQIEYKLYSNSEVFHSLAQILRECEYGGKARKIKAKSGYRVMLD